jgi:hypothetical protein
MLFLVYRKLIFLSMQHPEDCDIRRLTLIERFVTQTTSKLKSSEPNFPICSLVVVFMAELKRLSAHRAERFVTMGRLTRDPPEVAATTTQRSVRLGRLATDQREIYRIYSQHAA